jgi:hypothetical protein
MPNFILASNASTDHPPSTFGASFSLAARIYCRQWDLDQHLHADLSKIDHSPQSETIPSANQGIIIRH